MRRAFTLSELLIALTVVGVIAVLTVPSVTENAHIRGYLSTLQTTYRQISEALNDAMLSQKIYTVEDFDFPLKDEDETQSHAFMRLYLDIQKDCGRSSAGCFAQVYKDIDSGRSRSDMLNYGDFVVLRNGVALGINDDFSKYIFIDVNNVDPPNVLGRDFFLLNVTDKGELSTKDVYKMDTLQEMASDCSTFDGYFFTCFDYLQQNNWKMDY